MSPLNSSNFHRIFDKLDRNGDGFLSLGEFTWFLERIGAKTSEDELELLLGQKGLDRIDFAIFCDVLANNNFDGSVFKDGEVVNQKNQVVENDLVKTFQVFDANKDGFISSEELQSTLCRLGLMDEDCEKDCKSMINVYDTNSDGKHDFEEFVQTDIYHTVYSPVPFVFAQNTGGTRGSS